MSRSIAIVGVIATGLTGAALGLGGPVSAATASWTWRATGSLGTHSVCAGASRKASSLVCLYRVPNAPRTSGEVTGVVQVTNRSDRITCYGVSLSTSYMGGVQSFCVGPHSTGSYRTGGAASHYRATQISLFVTSGSKTAPVSPERDATSSPFTVTFRESL